MAAKGDNMALQLSMCATAQRTGSLACSSPDAYRFFDMDRTAVSPESTGAEYTLQLNELNH